ncbi:hypothetical protein D3C75_1008750 [compost metagenome]
MLISIFGIHKQTGNGKGIVIHLQDTSGGKIVSQRKFIVYYDLASAFGHFSRSQKRAVYIGQAMKAECAIKSVNGYLLSEGVPGFGLLCAGFLYQFLDIFLMDSLKVHPQIGQILLFIVLFRRGVHCRNCGKHTGHQHRSDGDD